MVELKSKCSLIAFAFLTGCGVAPIDSATQKAQEKEMQRAKITLDSSVYTSQRNQVNTTDRIRIPVVEVPSADSEFKTSNTAWLANKRIRLVLDKPVPLNEVVKIFFAQGVNINTTLPLDSYMYGGMGVNETSADAALKLVLSSVGLDYELDNVNKIVLIKPMESRTWYINLGSRSSTYSSNGTSASGGSGTGGQGGVVGQGGGGVPSALQGGGANSSSNVGTSISSSDNFWTSLRAELTSRLTILVPNSNKQPASMGVSPSSGATPPVPTPLNLKDPIPPALTAANTQGTPAPNAANAAGGMFVSRQVGAFSLNPETGAVTIQAPHWILNGIDTYIKRVQDMYNVDITFAGELLMLTNDQGQTEGLDIASFGRYAKTNYGFGVKNNGLGGVTVSVPDTGFSVPQITSGKTPISGTLVGVTNLISGFQVFNNYLSSHGTVNVLQKPQLTTTSGVPVEFSKMVTEYYNAVSQQSSSGGAAGNAATSTQNTLVPVDLGTTIRINPRFDVSTGLIRAQISLYQALKSGSQTVTQSLSAGNSVQQVPVEIPILTKLNYSGEALLQDGDMIIIGGQTDSTTSVSGDGVTGLKDTFLSPIFGNKSRSSRVTTFYFALRVSTHKRDNNEN